MENVQVQIEDLMDSRKVTFEPIAPQYFIVILLRTLLFCLVVTGGIAGILYKNEVPVSIVLYTAGGCVLLAGIWLTLVKWSFQYRGIAVREQDVIFRNSFINITETLVPYNRVQHVKLTRSIVEKLLGLSELYIYTAAGGNHNLSIAGLRVGDAEKIKSYILDKLKTTAVTASPGDVAANADAGVPSVETTTQDKNHGNT